MAAARAQSRPVILDFRADWCGSCLRLEKEVWPHPTVRAAAARFVALQVDLTGQQPAAIALSKTYDVQSLPTVVLIDSAGHTLPTPRLRTALPPRAVARLLRGVP